MPIRTPLIAAIAMSAVVACVGPRATSSSQADIDAITRANEAWVEAIKAGDLDRTMAPLAPDIVWMPPYEEPLIGFDATREWLTRRLKWADQYTHAQSIVVLDEVVVNGDWAFTRITFKGVLQPKAGGPPIPHNTKYISIWRRQADGGWKIARDIWSSNDPLGT